MSESNVKLEPIKNESDQSDQSDQSDFITKIKDLMINEIILEDVFYIYKDHKLDVVALNNLSVKFKTGEISVIMGPSGSGKSTLLNVVGGLLTPSSGRINLNHISIGDLSINQLRHYRKEKIGIIFQSKNLLPYLTVKKNISFALDIAKYSREEKKLKLKALIEKFNLEDLKDHKPDELSGGQQQKASLAVALANDPQIILADEPTGDLDTGSRNKIIEIFTQLRNEDPNRIIIVVSHDPVFLKIADNAFFIEDGAISSTLEIGREQESIGGGFQRILQSETQPTKIHPDTVLLKSSQFGELKEDIENILTKLQKIENINKI
jgi:putative ABC transport system ATP-binding protein